MQKSEQAQSLLVDCLELITRVYSHLYTYVKTKNEKYYYKFTTCWKC